MTEAIAPTPARIRIRDTFLAPRRLADELSGSTPWLGVLLVSTAIAVVAVLGMPDQVFLEPMSDPVGRRGAPVDITSDPEIVVRWGRAMGMLATLATHPMIAFVLAGLLTGVFSVLGGGRGSFLEYLSLSSHGLLIPAFGTALTLAARLGAELLGYATPLGLARLPELTGREPIASLLMIDPFVIWMLIVVAVGTSRFDRRRGAMMVIVILFLIYLSFLLLTNALFDAGRGSAP